MYILLIFVHSLFIFITHIFGYFLLEWVFVALLLFFLLYFSPIFFFKDSKQKSGDSLFLMEFSPQKSLIVPLFLTYAWIYVLAFTFSLGISQAINLHTIIFLWIFGIILGYILVFDWKTEIFFDILQFHLIFSYITLAVIGWYYFFNADLISIFGIIFSFVTIIFSILFFLFDNSKRLRLFYSFLFSLIPACIVILMGFFPKISLSLLFGIIFLIFIFLFEKAQIIKIFTNFLQESKIFFLAGTLFFSLLFIWLFFWDFSVIYFLIISIIFFISVHIRFSNIVCYTSAIFLIFFIYTSLFISIFSTKSVFFSLIFIFLLPIVMISNTYFWKEKQKYDFAIIHYSSIAFSVIFIIYSYLFFDWWKSNIVFSSFSLILLAILFYLSYFRFYKKS